MTKRQMTPEIILEGNKLIAEFMDWHFSTSFRGYLPDHWVNKDGEAVTPYTDYKAMTPKEI